MKIWILMILAIISATPATPTFAQEHRHGAAPQKESYDSYFPNYPWDNLRRRGPISRGGKRAEVEEPCVDNPGLKRGQKGYMHCRDHPHLSKVFTTSNCACTTGECRATDWKSDAKSPVGIAIKFEDKWCPISSYIDPRFVKIPPELRDEPAYTCILDSAPLDENGCPKRSCNIINTSS